MVEHRARQREPLIGVGPERWVEVGRVLRPNGLDGSLVVKLHGEDPQNLLESDRLRLCGGAGSIPFVPVKAESTGPAAGGRARVRIWLRGLSSREKARVWSGAAVEIPEAALRPLPEGEFYWREILGLRARLPDGALLGSVEDIWATASADVLVIRRGSKRFLVPAADGFLTRVDREAGELWIDPPAELLEPVEAEEA